MGRRRKMKPARLCVTVTADTTAELRTRRDQVGDFGGSLLAIGHAGPVSAAAGVKQRNGAGLRRWSGDSRASADPPADRLAMNARFDLCDREN